MKWFWPQAEQIVGHGNIQSSCRVSSHHWRDLCRISDYSAGAEQLFISGRLADRGIDGGCGACAEGVSRYGPGGFGDELAALEVHDLLVLGALWWLRVLLWDAGALVCVVHDGCFCPYQPMRWVTCRKESMP